MTQVDDQNITFLSVARVVRDILRHLFCYMPMQHMHARTHTRTHVRTHAHTYTHFWINEVADNYDFHHCCLYSLLFGDQYFLLSKYHH